jgi:hypothetical protein
MLEFAVSLLAWICFGWLYYRLAVLLISLPYNLRHLRTVHSAIDGLLAELKAHPEWSVVDRSKLLKQLSQDFTGPAVFNPIAMIARVAEMDRRGVAPHWISVPYLLWRARLGMDWSRHSLLGDVANDWGIWFTCTGSIFVMAEVADDPIAALSGLALSSVTTAAGLLVGMAVRGQLAGRFAGQLKAIELLAQETLLELVDRLPERGDFQLSPLSDVNGDWGDDSYWEARDVMEPAGQLVSTSPVPALQS